MRQSEADLSKEENRKFPIMRDYAVACGIDRKGQPRFKRATRVNLEAFSFLPLADPADKRTSLAGREG
jgi:uncharacterized heparinase superfamily protein